MRIRINESRRELREYFYHVKLDRFKDQVRVCEDEDEVREYINSLNNKLYEPSLLRIYKVYRDTQLENELKDYFSYNR